MLDNFTLFDGKTLARVMAQVKVESAINPLLWALLILSAPCLALIFMGNYWQAVVGIVIFAALVSTFLGSFIYLMLNRPELLRSESYQLEREKMLLGHKGKVIDVLPNIMLDALPAPATASAAYTPPAEQQE